MKKNMVLVFAIMLICILLTACVETSIGVEVKDNGGEIATALFIEKSFYEMMEGAQVSGLEGMTQGETTMDGADYITFTKTQSYETYEEMEAALMDMNFMDGDSAEEEQESEAPEVGFFKSVKISKEERFFEKRFSFKASTNIQEADEEMAVYNMSVNDVFKFRLEITMPGTIRESKGGEVLGNTLSCDIANLSQINEIAAVSKVPNIGRDDIIFIILLIILFALMFAVMSRYGGSKART